MEKRKASKRWIVIALVLCLVSMIGASAVQTGGGSITVKDLRWETTVGREMSGLLFIPKGVSAENPAPAVVVSHGMYNNREMQDLNFVELSRRGYVVLSMDMFSHGSSESTTTSAAEILVGMYEAVKMMATLPYVDAGRIGITGHSLGGMSSNTAVVLDNNAEKQLISAVLLNCADATYKDSAGAYANIYGSRNVGILAAQYDEWFFTQKDENGETTAPRDFIKNSNAQSFLHFGTDPQGMEPRAAYTPYTQEIDGKEAIRAIYNPAIIHPWSHFSKQSTEATINFFQEALGAPNPIGAGNQIWQWKVLFNFLGLLGFAMFVVSFTIAMVYTPAFSALRVKEPVVPVEAKGRAGKLWFWISGLVGAAFGGIVYLPILKAMQGHVSVRGFVRQSSPVAMGTWAAACGLFAILVMVIYYRSGRKSGLSLAGRGIGISWKKLLLTILLAAITVTVSYGLVFIADYFFKVDFRIWTIAVKTFNAEKLLLALFPSLPLFLVYYVANSVAVNCFNYNNLLGKKEWVNTAVVAAFNAIPAVVLLLLQYVTFFIGGHLMPGFTNMYIVWLFPVVVYLPVSAIMARKIYRATNNPYLPGIINATIIAIISCSNTLTWL